jgi:3',5'-cyclic AMP phosphodiesterase CpdA
MSNLGMGRREAMKLTGLTAAAVWLGASGRANAGWPGQPVERGAGAGAGGGPKRACRLAHMTDIHVQPERRGGEGMKACVKHVMALADRPELVITGGDLVMDSFEQEFDRTKELWELYTRTLKEDCGVAVQHTLGNHDIWGWNKGKSKCTGSEPRWGKKWFCEIAGRDKAYQAFDRGNWRVIQLDSVHTDPKDASGYIGMLDEEQMAWLEGELKGVASGRPVMVVSHIPILSLCAMVFDGNAKQKEQRWEVSAGNMHIDGAKLHKLFRDSGKVKLCLSGHIHKNDRVEMDGVTYICNGAVCGAWWQGKKDRCEEGYGVVDLYEDGSFRNEYVGYGWKAEG